MTLAWYVDKAVMVAPFILLAFIFYTLFRIEAGENFDAIVKTLTTSLLPIQATRLL